MAKARLKFTRTGTVVETGEVVVDGSSMSDIDLAAYSKDFKNFVVQNRVYDDESWRFELIEVEEIDEARPTSA